MIETSYIRPKNIVWIQTAFIGDIILTTAAAKALAELRPEVNQYFITTPIGKSALEGLSLFEEIIPFNKKKGLSEVGAVKKIMETYQLQKSETIILQPHKSLRSSLLAISLGFKRITYSETVLSGINSVSVSRVALLHESERIKLLLEPLGISREKSAKFKPFLDSYKNQIDVGSGKVVAVAPGSVWGTKKWKIEGFLSVVNKILNETNWSVVLIGSPSEKEDTKYIMDRLDEDLKARVKDLAGETSLKDLLGLYPKFSALLCNDSSPIHYASAFNVPTVAIFGATKPSMGFSPLADKSAMVEDVDLKCRPCSDHGPKTCPLTHFKCMNNVEAESVYKELSVILSDGA